MQCIFDKEIYGYGEKLEAKEKVTVKKVRRFFNRSLCLQSSFAFIFATFGWPKPENEHLWSYLSLFPLIAIVQHTAAYFHPEVPIQSNDGSVSKALEEETKLRPSVRPKTSRSKNAPNQVSISSTFYKSLFGTKVLCAAFL